MEGTEFGEIDTLALNNGVNHKDERRLSAITKKVISKSIKNGSAYHPLDDLRREIAKVDGITKNEIDDFLQYCKDNPFESGIWFAQSKYHGDLVASSIHAGNEIKTISPLRQFLVSAKNRICEQSLIKHYKTRYLMSIKKKQLKLRALSRYLLLLVDQGRVSPLS